MECGEWGARACADEAIPTHETHGGVGEEADVVEVDETGRPLRYAACTRARVPLLITAVEPASEFLDDLRS